MRDIQDFARLKIQLASPDTIRSWSYGEVKKPETINYRTLRPERDGLFCERIFGTTKEWECYCGKFKSIRYRGIVCDRCGVEVTHFKVRRERTGHIELAAPVSHIWYYHAVPSRMGLLLDLQVASLRSVLYYEKYIVIDPGDTDLKKNELLTEEEYNSAMERYNGAFDAGQGAEAIKKLLDNLDLDALAAELREKMVQKGAKSDKRLLKRIGIVEDFRSSGNKASWMILDVIPVIPPDLRPMVQLEGGRFATSDLNDLYRRVINRNNRLRRLQQLSAPDVIVRNEKRMLQEAVDALFDNTKRHQKVVKGASNRPLKSISDMLKGKQGRFRQNLLGKRVDYSGRSVIVCGPELKLWQCGLPEKMALELFKPFLQKKLVDKGVVFNIKKAKTLVESESPEVYQILDEVVREHPVLLNRAPTLHRLGIQAFEPVLVPGKALKLHPLACKAFNADFDGDQMAIHVPLTQAAQMECWTLMLSARNLLDPANGNSIVYPSQDMVLGIYYMTSIKPGAKGTDKLFSSADEVRLAATSGAIEWQAEVKLLCDAIHDDKGASVGYGLQYSGSGAAITKKIHDGEGIKADEKSGKSYVYTSAGRLRFNEAMPDEVDYYNIQMGDKQLRKMIEEVYHSQGAWLTIKMLDAIKECGYKNATFFGATLSMDDILIPDEKAEIVAKATEKVEMFNAQARAGHRTERDCYDDTVAVWQNVDKKLSDKMMEKLKKDKDGFNTIYMMATSGARGSPKQISQLASMRGLMQKPNGDIIALPIKSNFKEGLSVIEFFISTNGARKGLSDTALKTANAGYMTRRLVDVSQNVVVNEEDCGTINGIEYRAIKDGEIVKESLASRIEGHYSAEHVYDPDDSESKRLLCDVNQYIDKKLAEKIEKAGVEKVKVRTVLTCESKYGVCVKCYGKDLARNKIVEVGEAVGTIAAQSIGQPGTQLTLRTFHTGGAAEAKSDDNKIRMKYDVYVKLVSGPKDKEKLASGEYPGYVVTENGDWLFTRRGRMVVAKVLGKYTLEAGDELAVTEGAFVRKDKTIIRRASGDVLASDKGEVLLKDEGRTVYLISSNEQDIKIENGSTIKKDFVQAKCIVPFGEELGTFEVHTEPIIAEQEGIVHYEDIIKGETLDEQLDTNGNTNAYITSLHLEAKQPRIIITDEPGNELGSYYMPTGAHLIVKDGQNVKQGEKLAETAKGATKANDITMGLPRVAELFEARKPKEPTVLAKINGIVRFGKIVKGKRIISIEGEEIKGVSLKYDHQIPMTKRLLVRDGDWVEAGEKLCDGQEDPHEVLEIKGENELQNFLMEQVQTVYRDQGVKINGKHIGIIIRQMLKKVEIVSVGDTKFIFGDQVDKWEFRAENERVTKEGGEPAIAKPMFLGISKAALGTDSFISASSFQETTRVLTTAAIKGSVDYLRGLKENVIIGHMIPAGTGMRRYSHVKLTDSSNVDLDARMNEIIAQRQEEERLRKEEEDRHRELMEMNMASSSDEGD
ncbi:MAG: DNA-directed RNA polymerase subunit beta' [Treponema sp.]|nr:DNA-directed RNA polymerase subunit beta' [Treponema sp.]